MVAVGSVFGLVPAAGAFVYWAGHNAFAGGRAGLDPSGADPRFVTLGLAIPCGVAVDHRYVYWTTRGQRPPAPAWTRHSSPG
ncbi:MAG TPA: hypothetical protein VG410_08700 [Solirubrobacteraceae bacterium]|nr:hypothetical protein [Solirubrobacteraceae bacterium]